MKEGPTPNLRDEFLLLATSIDLARSFSVTRLRTEMLRRDIREQKER